MTEPDDRTPLPDDDPELARFFDGDDLTGPPVPDGGKGNLIYDCEDCD
jgi:hypothetical protein